MYISAPSELHGVGLFADRPIKKNQTIGRLDFVPADPNNLDHPHVLWITDELAVRVICDLRFINHSGEPNVAYCDDGTVVALRKIKPGEELLHDYEGDAEVEDVSDDADAEESDADADEMNPFAGDSISDPAMNDAVVTLPHAMSEKVDA